MFGPTIIPGLVYSETKVSIVLSVQLVPPPSLLVHKAINYYETALKSHANEAGLRCELAQLYLKLTYYDKAKKTLVAGLHIGEGGKG